jgi:hypothetical protein
MNGVTIVVNIVVDLSTLLDDLNARLDAYDVERNDPTNDDIARDYWDGKYYGARMHAYDVAVVRTKYRRLIVA